MKNVLLSFLCVLSLGVYAQNNASVKKPNLMVIPSDNLLNLLGCLETFDNQGTTAPLRDYQKAFRENSDLVLAINAIAEKFRNVGYPIENLEMRLRQIENDNARNLVGGIVEDPRSVLLRTARPDIVLDLGYELKKGGLSSQLTFNLSATDAYSNKYIAAIGSPGMPTSNSNIAQLLADEVERNLNNLQSQMTTFFDDLRENGREVRLLIQVNEDSQIDLEFDECGTDFLSDYIQDWVKKNTVNNQFKRVFLTASEISFSDVRIPLYDSEGLGLGLDEWLRPFRRDLVKTCKMRTLDRTEGLGDGRIVFN